MMKLVSNKKGSLFVGDLEFDRKSSSKKVAVSFQIVTTPRGWLRVLSVS